MIHPTAIVDPGAEIDSNVEIGPYSVIAGDVKIHAGTIIGPHVTIDQYTTIGADCKIFQHAAIGAVPQDLKFGGEKSVVKIGRGTTVREFVTIHRGTEAGGGITEIGEENFLMAYTHIAHDCLTGQKVIFANAATLAGHIRVGDCATLGAFVAVHQFVRIGDYAFIGGVTGVTKDIPPYVLASGTPRARLHGLNAVGLKRHGFSTETMHALKRTYRILFRLELTLNEGIERVAAEVDQIPEVVNFIEFIKSSERGITR
ncbi:MAG: acyl-ACP--UDP-N-acetylglucosamine O-acyltransferase [Deltaproteobacteria bacterium]|nr:acyl-ACP--UDP-N-acetylglucosamine O-acyltransferase [Deltaproteobacteria bacterium]MBW1793927.1 acyl-ACP--UDP-N-acetylglucosamine O-acyltransferase [Deltaproteobacteria bacterium]MBW2331397.1 acyl-ACP--UDP-N-acetylglucosamine O-acyltransferase [Deltaproteobacteria bacterium]